MSSVRNCFCRLKQFSENVSSQITMEHSVPRICKANSIRPFAFTAMSDERDGKWFSSMDLSMAATLRLLTLYRQWRGFIGTISG